MPQNKKIVIVVDSIDVNDSSGSKVNVAMIQNLATLGFLVTVYHYSFKNIQIENVNCVYINENRFSINFFLSRIVRKIQLYFNLNVNKYLENWFGFSFTFFNDISSIKKALLKCDINPDLVITLSKAASFRPHYAMLSIEKWHSIWMAYVHDPFPFHCYPEPYNWNMPGYKQKEVFFKEVVKKAKYLSTPSKSLGIWMNQFFENFVDKNIVIPHQNYSKNSTNNFKPTISLDNNYCNFLHLGALFNQRNPKFLLEAISEINEEFSNLPMKFYFIGETEYHTDLFENYKNRLKEKLIFINRSIPFIEALQLQNNANVNLIIEADANCSPFLPGKFPHCLKKNIPIFHIGPDNSECVELLGKDYPYHATSIDKEKMKGIIIEFMNLWKENKYIPFERNDLLNYFSIDHLKKQILKCI